MSLLPREQAGARRQSEFHVLDQVRGLPEKRGYFPPEGEVFAGVLARLVVTISIACGRHGYVSRDFNPARYVKPYKDQGRERYLSSEELRILCEVLRQAETVGIPWKIKAEGPTAKHLAKPDNQIVA